MSTMAEVIERFLKVNYPCKCGAGDDCEGERPEAEALAEELGKAGYGKLEDLTPVGFLDSIRADAWDEGHHAGVFNVTDMTDATFRDNPYRGAGHE